MIEAPEALFLSGQLNKTIKGKVINDVIVGHSPHKFAFYYGNPETDYIPLLVGKTVGETYARGGMIDISVENTHLVFTDGANIRFYAPAEKIPSKHQLLIIFTDESCLVVSVRMYGGLLCFPHGEFNAPLSEYYNTACEKPQVMTEAFDKPYFFKLINEEAAQNKTAKAFLATGQTIPGLGNGVLQDILFNARIHPRTKIGELSDIQKNILFNSIKSTLAEMNRLNGRNSETDLSGINGQYIPILSKDTAGKECPRCDGIIKKESYLGGSIYYCKDCQK